MEILFPFLISLIELGVAEGENWYEPHQQSEPEGALRMFRRGIGSGYAQDIKPGYRAGQEQKYIGGFNYGRPMRGSKRSKGSKYANFAMQPLYGAYKRPQPIGSGAMAEEDVSQHENEETGESGGTDGGGKIGERRYSGGVPRCAQGGTHQHQDVRESIYRRVLENISKPPPSPAPENPVYNDVSPKINEEGSFTRFIIMLFDSLAKKDIRHISNIVHQFINRIFTDYEQNKLNDFGEPLLQHLTSYLEKFELLNTFRQKSILINSKKVLESRKTDLPDDLNYILDYVNGLYTGDDEESMNKMIEGCQAYPYRQDPKKDLASHIIDDIILEKFRKVSNSSRLELLISINTMMSEMFGGDVMVPSKINPVRKIRRQLPHNLVNANPKTLKAILNETLLRIKDKLHIEVDDEKSNKDMGESDYEYSYEFGTDGRRRSKGNRRTHHNRRGRKRPHHMRKKHLRHLHGRHKHHRLKRDEAYEIRKNFRKYERFMKFLDKEHVHGKKSFFKSGAPRELHGQRHKRHKRHNHNRHNHRYLGNKILRRDEDKRHRLLNSFNNIEIETTVTDQTATPTTEVIDDVTVLAEITTQESTVIVAEVTTATEAPVLQPDSATPPENKLVPEDATVAVVEQVTESVITDPVEIQPLATKVSNETLTISFKQPKLAIESNRRRDYNKKRNIKFSYVNNGKVIKIEKGNPEHNVPIKSRLAFRIRRPPYRKVAYKDTYNRHSINNNKYLLNNRRSMNIKNGRRSDFIRAWKPKLFNERNYRILQLNGDNVTNNQNAKDLVKDINRNIMKKLPKYKDLRKLAGFNEPYSGSKELVVSVES